MHSPTRTQVVPSITLAEYDRRKAAGEYDKSDREVEVKITQADAAKLLRLLEGTPGYDASQAHGLTTFELALRLAIYRAVN